MDQEYLCDFWQFVRPDSSERLLLVQRSFCPYDSQKESNCDFQQPDPVPVSASNSVLVPASKEQQLAELVVHRVRMLSDIAKDLGDVDLNALCKIFQHESDQYIETCFWKPPGYISPALIVPRVPQNTEENQTYLEYCAGTPYVQEMSRGLGSNDWNFFNGLPHSTQPKPLPSLIGGTLSSSRSWWLEGPVYLRNQCRQSCSRS